MHSGMSSFSSGVRQNSCFPPRPQWHLIRGFSVSVLFSQGRACPPPPQPQLRSFFLQMILHFSNMIVLSWFQALILAEQSHSASFTPPARECSCGSERDQSGMNIWSASNAVCTGRLSCIHGSESHKAELTLPCSSNFDISHPAPG